jgi:hypothetical protein
MKKILLFVALFLPLAASAGEERLYPWMLNAYGGGASFCDEAGCFGPSGYTFGASFGRYFTPTLAFELEGTYAYAEQTQPARVDIGTGVIFIPTLERTRVWGGGHFLIRLSGAHDTSHLFVSIGLIGGYEQQQEVVDPGLPVFVTPTKDIGIKGGLAGGAGYNLWIGDSWGVRPEVRYYLVAGDLSGIRYTAGFLKRF